MRTSPRDLRRMDAGSRRMMPHRAGGTNRFAVTVMAALGLLVILGVVLLNLGKPQRVPPAMPNNGAANPRDLATQGNEGRATELLFYCAAGCRRPIQQIVEDYAREYGVSIQLQFGGSNTLLSQISVAKTGDLFLAADDSYMQLAKDKDLVDESLPVATQRPVIAVKQGNPRGIHGIEDLLHDDVNVAFGNPDQAAIGRTARQLLTDSGHWAALEQHITAHGVFKPTVPEVANDIKLGSVDAGIIWDTTLALYPDLEAIRCPELDAGQVLVTLGVLSSTQNPTETLRFARYLAARDKGLVHFRENGFDVVDGDTWAEVPELTFFCGAVNRRAVEDIVRQFEQREGVRVNTVYNGCGILTAQMRSMRDQEQASGFPDTYLACDRYYLDSVADWFQEDVDVSDTEVVIAVPKGNPAGIKSLQDLARPGVRISVGQPEQCTIGVLTRQLLEAEGVLEEVKANVVTQTASSSMLLPTVTTGSVDATLAYATDTLAESDKVDTIRIASPAATAVQPFAISKSSAYKYLSRRLYDTIARSRDMYEKAGFHFRVENPEAMTHSASTHATATRSE